MRNAFMLIVDFQQLPDAVKLASHQPKFVGLHGIEAFSGDIKPTCPFVDEYGGESDYVLRNGVWVKIYTDCVPASGCMGAAEMTHNRIKVNDTVREQLQAKMGKSGKAANEDDLARGYMALWDLQSVASVGWAAIATGLGGVDAYCWIAEPMNEKKTYQRVRVGDLQNACRGGGYAYCKVVEVATLEPVIDIREFETPVHGGIAAGQTLKVYDPNLPGQVADSWTNGGTRGTSCILDAYERVGWKDDAGNAITGPVPHGTFIRIAKGGFPAKPSMEGRLALTGDLTISPTPVVKPDPDADSTPYDQSDIDAAVTAQQAKDKAEADARVAAQRTADNKTLQRAKDVIKQASDTVGALTLD